ncbi:hypothetical protein GE061_013363 [Apolygus lucorum]|uniref:Uncharacterized protein n=1 Tax=Apolygus lucorum TaxID=248454 RepID=A0A8S9XNT6_APOLU|nr:hypothetical protein GE061_013363 [Apolygus lucorum]
MCVGEALKDGIVSLETANRMVKRLSHEGEADRNVYAWGISSDGSLEIAKYYDPSGDIVALNLGHLRWTAPRNRVMHANIQRKIILAYTWESIRDTKPIEHWFDLTSISGDPGAHWSFAEDGYVAGIADTFTTKSCAGYEDLKQALSTKQTFITYYMNPYHLCIKFSEKVQTVIGKYREEMMVVHGKETKTRIPQWECSYTGTWKCVGIMTESEKRKVIELINLN